MKPKFLVLWVLAILVGVHLLSLFFYSEFYKNAFQNQLSSEYVNGEIIYNNLLLSQFLNSSNSANKLTRQKLSFILRLRKLVLWSTREVNLRIQGQECIRWWANPLSVYELRERRISSKVTKYTVLFHIQPGEIPFETVVDVRRHDRERSDLLFEPDDLVFISGRRLDVIPENCGTGTVPQSVRVMCLCLEEKNSAEEKTRLARQEWRLQDPELLTWPPDASFMLPDYFSFGSMGIYNKSPKKNVEYCGSNLKIIIFVSSSPKNFKGRMAIRQSYGNTTFLESQSVKLLFAFDMDHDIKLQRMIDSEFDKFDDIIQAKHAHSYHNLTFRDLTMFNWLVTQCRLQNASMPQWIIKTDDDYFINVPRALEVATANPDVEAMGGGNCGQPVIRDTGYMKKYYTPRYIYPAGIYTGYLSGATWIIRSDVLTLILSASLTTPLLHVDDVYVMGMLTREVGILPRGSSFMSYGREAGACRIKQMINSAVTDAKDFGVHWDYFRESIPADCIIGNNTKILPFGNAAMDDCLFA